MALYWFKFNIFCNGINDKLTNFIIPDKSCRLDFPGGTTNSNPGKSSPGNAFAEGYGFASYTGRQRKDKSKENHLRTHYPF